MFASQKTDVVTDVQTTGICEMKLKEFGKKLRIKSHLKK